MTVQLQNKDAQLEDSAVIIETTESFLRDLKNFPLAEQEQVNNKLQAIASLIEEETLDELVQLFNKVKGIKLTNYSSSLYQLKVSSTIEILLFFEEDPLFERKIITLLHVFYRQDMEKAIADFVKSFYQNEISEMPTISDVD
jgi:H2-forming N5,N10-methylenetetrahydromethanopterin dehydrogenase-like enzyme